MSRKNIEFKKKQTNKKQQQQQQQQQQNNFSHRKVQLQSG